MAALKIITYKVRGLNSPSKRYQILQEMKRLSANIVFLQETHLKITSKTRLNSKEFPTWIHSYSPNKRSKGTAIGFDRNIRFSLEATEIDPDGRYLFVKGTLLNMRYTLVNVYCPNVRPAVYLRKILNKLEGFREGLVILAGDLNFVFDPL